MTIISINRHPLFRPEKNKYLFNMHFSTYLRDIEVKQYNTLGLIGTIHLTVNTLRNCYLKLCLNLETCFLINSKRHNLSGCNHNNPNSVWANDLCKAVSKDFHHKTGIRKFCTTTHAVWVLCILFPPWDHPTRDLLPKIGLIEQFMAGQYVHILMNDWYCSDMI